jgi:hypothetical protein
MVAMDVEVSTLENQRVVIQSREDFAGTVEEITHL